MVWQREASRGVRNLVSWASGVTGVIGIRRQNAKCQLLKAQVSVELLVTLGVVIAFTIPIVLLLLSVSQLGYESTTLSQADAAAKMVADNINEVFAQGLQAKRTIVVSFPTNMKSFDVKGNEVIVTLRTSTGDYQAVSPIFANATLSNQINRTGLLTLRITAVQKPDNQVGVEIYG